MVRHDSASSILWNVPYVEFRVMEASVGVIIESSLREITKALSKAQFTGPVHRAGKG